MRSDKKENWTVHYLPFDIMRNSIWAAQIVAAHDDLYQYVSSNVKPEDTVMGQECEDCQSDGDDTAKGDEFLKSLDYAYKVKDTPADSGQASPEEMAGYESDYRNPTGGKETTKFGADVRARYDGVTNESKKKI